MRESARRAIRPRASSRGGAAAALVVCIPLPPECRMTVVGGVTGSMATSVAAASQEGRSYLGPVHAAIRAAIDSSSGRGKKPRRQAAAYGEAAEAGAREGRREELDHELPPSVVLSTPLP